MAVATERLWLTVDGDVVLDEDPAARTLLCAEGDEIPEGYKAPKASAKAEPKAVAKAANKSVTRPSGDK